MEIETPHNNFYNTLYLQKNKLQLPAIKIRIDEWVSHQIELGTDYFLIWKKIDQIAFELDQTQPILSWSLLSNEGLGFKQLFYEYLSKLPNRKQYLENQLLQFWNQYQTYEKFIEFIEFTQDLDIYDEFRDMFQKFLQAQITQIQDIDQLWPIYNYIKRISKLMTLWDIIKPDLIKRVDWIINNTKLDYQNKEHLEKFYKINQFAKSNRFYQLLQDHFQQNFQRIINDQNEQDKIMIHFTLYAQEITEFWKQFYPQDQKWLDQIGISYQHFIHLEPQEMTKMFIELIHITLQEFQINNDKVRYMLKIYKDQIKYFHYREMFETLYTQKLLERIFQGLTPSIETELNYILDMQDQLSDTFTKRAQELVKNIQERKQIDVQNIVVELVIVKKELWPYHEPQDCNFLQDIQYQIQTNYPQTFEKKKWQILLQFSTVLIKGFNQYLFEVSIPIAKLLLLFNVSNTLSIPIILEQLQIDQFQLNQLVSILQSLNLIKQVNMILELNLNFHSGKKLIKINNQLIQSEQSQVKPQLKDSTEGRQFLNDKKYILESVIVKILKKEKEMQFNILVAQLNQIFKIQLAPEDIKFQLEQLITKGYITRCIHNLNLIQYLP
ncbi:ubiquitin ligase (cullin) of SCF [Paramecium bursaria]